MKQKIICVNAKCKAKIPKKFAKEVKEVNGMKQYICANCAIDALVKICTKLQEKVLVLEKREKQVKEGRNKLILP